jgi:hypothetical protein
VIDISLIKRVRDTELSSHDEEAVEQELEKWPTFVEQRAVQRLAAKGRSSTMRSCIRGATGESSDGRGRDSSYPISPDLRVPDAAFDYCPECAEFEPRRALRLANRSNVFVYRDSSCRIMAKLPNIMRAKDRCRSCVVLTAAIQTL